MHPYKIAGLILGALALLFLGFMVVGIILPSGWQAERAVEIGAPPEEVFPYLNTAVNWDRWTPSPESGTELFGPTEGAGSGRRWDDLEYGQGEFVIVSSQPARQVTYEVQVEGGSIEIRGQLNLDAVPGGTAVRWREEGDFGWNPLLGYLAGRMNELQGAALDASLGSLKELVESGVSSPRD